MYDNYAAKLRGGKCLRHGESNQGCGERSYASVKATKVAVKLVQKQFYRVDYLSTELKQNLDTFTHVLR